MGMADHFKIQMCLMFRDLEVAEMEVELYRNSLYINIQTVINSNSLPYNLRHAQCDIKSWLMSRMMPFNTYHYISMLPIIFHSGANRRHFAQLMLSLETNCVSISDHYWLNPKSDINFVYDDKVINFKNTVWDNINPYQNNIWSNDLNQFLFNDMLFFSKDNPMPRFNNPIFTTFGTKEKKWDKEDDDWILEKRLTSEELEGETKCLEFFENCGILVPQYEIAHHSVSDKYQFEPHTIRDGFDTIRKKCLTSTNNQLTPLSWYINDDCDDDIHMVFSQVQKAVKIDEQILENFENVIVKYLSMNNDAPLRSSNIGFLVNIHNNAIPAVWSNIAHIKYNSSSNLENLSF
jgi:hypothetical protein